MTSCTCENWTLEDVASALNNMHKDGKLIVVPMFQRGKRWSKEQERTFIDSMYKGYPVGTMLFYKKIDNGVETYILVDGLQRGNTIRKYMGNPTEFYSLNEISENLCSDILHVMDETDDDISPIKSHLLEFIKRQNKLKFGVTVYNELAADICSIYGKEDDRKAHGIIMGLLESLFIDGQNQYECIAKSIIPVIVYNGEESNLPEIFERINSKGTALNVYEVYAASWPIDKKFKVNNQEIVDAVVRKYDMLASDGYNIANYDRDRLHNTKELNAFEFLFGMGKYLTQKYPNLSFNTKADDDTVNPLAFELINACLNDGDKISPLYDQVLGIDPNELLIALERVISFIDNCLAVVTRFKGNKRNADRIFHSKFQIMSMISTTFKEMYDNSDYNKISESWDAKSKILKKNLLHYYVYDIIAGFWQEGGTKKIFAVSKPNRYMQNISDRAWMVALNGYFEGSMLRTEQKKIKAVSNEDYVFMNCIYMNIFTAMDQLSMDKFDVEHIAPKAQMSKLIETTKSDGLPISSIANLCYLPDSANRSKGAKNFYQDKKYLTHVNLDEVESKYSFTTADDLEWMDYPYDNKDAESLKDFYTEYCTLRFKKLKTLFCESMGINVIDVSEEEQNIDAGGMAITSADGVNATDINVRCIQKLSTTYDDTFIKLKKKFYKAVDGSKGYIVFHSKIYNQGEKEKYWFSYRDNHEIKECQENFFVFGCPDETNMLVIPRKDIKEVEDALRFSLNENGDIYHRHLVFFRYPDGHMTWLLSLPEIREISIDQYKVNG